MSGFTLAKYIRLSSEDDDLEQDGKSESNSITNQRNLLDSFIHQTPEFSDARVLEFCDDGWSGKNFARPAVQELLDQVLQSKIQCIIVKDLSRFGRDYLTVGNYISLVFPFKGVRFISVNDGFDSIRPADVDSLETSFKTLLYDLYSRDLSRKVRSANNFRAKRGDFLSPFAPYGYIKDPANSRRLVIDPEAAEIVRRIFQMMADGHTTVQIAKALNRDAVPTPMLYKRAAGCSRTAWPSVNEENFWTCHGIDKILRDERYAGKNVYGKRMRHTVGDWHTAKVGKSDWITVDDTHEGIVTQEEFDRAQAVMREYMERDGLHLEGRALQRKVRCGVCGHAMVRSRGKHPYYICHTRRVTDAFSCPTEQIPECDIMETLLDGLRAFAAAAVEWGRIWKEEQGKRQRDAASARKAIAKLKETHEQQEQLIKDLYEAFALGEISKAEYLAAKTVMLQKRDGVAGRIAELKAELEDTAADGSLNNRFVTSFQQYAGIEEITSENAEDVLKEILIYPGGRLEIVWDYREEFEKLLLDLQGRRCQNEKSSDLSPADTVCELPLFRRLGGV